MQALTQNIFERIKVISITSIIKINDKMLDRLFYLYLQYNHVMTIAIYCQVKISHQTTMRYDLEINIFNFLC